MDDKHKIGGDCLAVGMMGMQFFYMDRDFYAGQFTKRAVPLGFTLTPRLAQFFISILDKHIPIFKSGSVRQFTSTFTSIPVTLPVVGDKIDFNSMEYFLAELEAERLAELEAYLKATGLDSTILTVEEEVAMAEFNNITWQEISLGDLFNRIEQGKRLKKDDQLPGQIPFVMSGVENRGVVGYVSNPVALFPGHSLTIDIFGNSFYRSERFGAGDDTGVYWNDPTTFSELAMLFISAVAGRSLRGQYSFANKLRSSRSHALTVKIPVRKGKIAGDFIELFMCAVQKLVIKDVVDFTAKRIDATRKVIER